MEYWADMKLQVNSWTSGLMDLDRSREGQEWIPTKWYDTRQFNL